MVNKCELKVTPEYGRRGRSFVVKDDATLVAAVREALDASPTGRVTIEILDNDHGLNRCDTCNGWSLHNTPIVHKLDCEDGGAEIITDDEPCCKCGLPLEKHEHDGCTGFLSGG